MITQFPLNMTLYSTRVPRRPIKIRVVIKFILRPVCEQTFTTKRNPLNATHNKSMNYCVLRVSGLWPERVSPSTVPLPWFTFGERNYVKCLAFCEVRLICYQRWKWNYLLVDLLNLSYMKLRHSRQLSLSMDMNN